MNPMICLRAIAASVLLMMAGWSQAATYSLFASLDGSQEVPPNASPGTGTGLMTYDDVSNQLNWNITFSDLTSGANNAHFHGPAAPGVNASPVITIPLGASLGMTSGSLVGMATLANETQEGQLLSGLWYINIHTANFAGGEIRGQVQVVPIPAALWLFGTGLGLLSMLARRKR